MNTRCPSALRLSHDETNSGLVVGNRLGVRHRAHSGKTTGGCRARAGSDCLDILAAWLAQMAVRVYESGRDTQTGAIENFCTIWLSQAAPGGLDLSRSEQKIRYFIY